MDSKEREVLLKYMEEKRAMFSNNSQASITFLKEIGILNSKGKVVKEYKNLCIPQGRD